VENPIEEPAPEPSAEPTPITSTEAPVEETSDPLLLLARAAKAARLAPAEEDRAVELLRERLAGGRAGITAAISPMIEGLPWIVCVNAVRAVWEQLSVPMRRHLMSSIAKNDSESAHRLRLSLARAVFKLDPAAGLKLAAAAAADLKHPETGALTAKYRQFFFNVFIGKGKPWLLQMPLADLKGADADALVHCAIECFPFIPPLSQLSILRWVYGAGRLKKVSTGNLEIAAKSLGRWNGKLQRQLQADIAELPPLLEAALKPEALKAEPEAQPEPETKPEPNRRPAKKSQPTPEIPAEASEAEALESAATEEPTSAPAPAAPLEELVIPGRAERLAKKEAEKLANKKIEQERRKPEPRELREPRATEERRPERPERPERPARGERAERTFDLKEALRGVESYVAGLRSELEQTTAQLRRQDQEGKRGGRSTRSVEENPVESEALMRHNARLEATVAELRLQLEDLAGHHEAVAESRQLHSDEPLAEGSAEQLTALLAIKLAESYETYEAMRKEPLDKVFRLDYRDLLGSVFDALIHAGVRLEKE